MGRQHGGARRLHHQSPRERREQQFVSLRENLLSSLLLPSLACANSTAVSLHTRTGQQQPTHQALMTLKPHTGSNNHGTNGCSRVYYYRQFVVVGAAFVVGWWLV